LGLLYSKNKSDYTQGTLFLEKAVKSNPNNKNAIRDLGITYGMQGDYTKSEALLSDAVKRFPNDGQLFYNLAITLYNLKKYEEAQKAFNKASELDSSIKPVKLVQ
jgi:tetratricopeptide (TPR) repeat protein